MRLYVASSWRNPHYPEVVDTLRRDGHEVYDFRHPGDAGPKPIGAGRVGFSWKQVADADPPWTVEQYITALTHRRAQEEFATDWNALNWCEGCVLALPCGRSAHLEAGYAIGRGKPVFILTRDGEEPELMYLAAKSIAGTLGQLLAHIRIEARMPRCIAGTGARCPCQSCEMDRMDRRIDP